MSAKYALIIANSEYTDAKLAQLSAPGKDAEAFADVLKAPDLASFDDVKTLINHTSYDARSAIARFLRDKKPEDLLVLYFSGHGVRDEQGHLFLATKDTDSTILDATALASDFITRQMDNCRSKRQVLILDCCNSGAFAYGTKGATGASMGTSTAFEGNGYGRVVLTATDSTQFAYEGDQVIGSGTTDSLFTHFLIKGLEGEADNDGDGAVSVDDLYDYASAQIRSLTPKQQPEKFVYHQQEQLILTTKVRPQTVKPLPLNDPDLELDLQSSRPYTREGAVRDLGVILNGKNLGKALTAEERLMHIIQTDDSRAVVKTAQQILADYHAAHGKPAVAAEPPVAVPLTGAPVTQPQEDVVVAEAPRAPEIKMEPLPPPAPVIEKPQVQPVRAQPVVVQPERLAAPQMNMHVNAAPAVSTPVAPAVQPQRKTSSRSMIVIGALVAVALCVGGGVLAYNILMPPAATATQAPDVPPAETQAPAATEAPTEAPVPTEVPTEAPTEAPAPTAISPFSHLLLSDNFADNSAGWPTPSLSVDYLDGTMTVSGGEYDWDLTAKTGFFRYELPSGQPTASDFSIATSGAAAIQGGTADYGLLLRLQGQGSSAAYYYFAVDDVARQYFFSVHNNGLWTDVVTRTSSSAIQADQFNDIRVVGIGSHFTFYINDQYVGEATDSTLSEGTYGLGAQLHNAGDVATFRFRSFELRSP